MSPEPATELDNLERGEVTSTTEDEATRPPGPLAGAKRREIMPGIRRSYLDGIHRPQLPPVDEESRFFDPTDKFWTQYLAAADKRDDSLIEVWKGEADASLIFTGLFAATVATFLVQTYQLLSPASTDTSAAALLQISRQLAGAANGTIVLAYDVQPFEVPAYAVRVNALWFLSLLISIFCALLATLMQGWARSYLFDVPSAASPHTRGRLHALLSFGAECFKVTEIIGLIVTLLHISVVLFVLGLLDLTSNINSVVHSVFLYAAILLALLYGVLTTIPLIWPDAPYHTPLTPLLRLLLTAATLVFFLLTAMLVAVVAQIFLAIISPFLHFIRRARVDMGLTTEEDFLNVIIRPPFEVLCDELFPSRLERLRTRVGIDGLPMRHVKHAIRQIRQSIDSNHELEAFLVAFSSFLLKEPHLDQNVTLLAECYGGRCCARAPNINTFPASSHYSNSASKAVIANWFDHFGPSKAFKGLSHDPHPHVSFLAYILLFGVRNNVRDDDKYTEKEKSWPCERLDFEQHIWDEDACVPRDYGWFEDDTIALPKSLAAFLRFTCVIVHFASLDVPSNPIHIHLSDWEPILNGLRDWTLEELASISETSGSPIFSVTLHKLLRDGDLSGFVYPNSPSVVPVQFSHDFRRGLEAIPSACVKDALRTVAKALPVQPPRPPSAFNPAPETMTSAGNDEDQELIAEKLVCEQQGQSSARGPLSTTVMRLALGPLSWGKRPMLEFRALMNNWRTEIEVRTGIPVVLAKEQPYPGNKSQGPQTFDIIGITDYMQDVHVIDSDSTDPSRDHQGYATIDFTDTRAAMQFMDAWKQMPPNGYDRVTAEVYQNEFIAERGNTNGPDNASTISDVQMEALTQ